MTLCTHSAPALSDSTSPPSEYEVVSWALGDGLDVDFVAQFQHWAQVHWGDHWPADWKTAVRRFVLRREEQAREWARQERLKPLLGARR
jgi:hypothetical protein